MPLNFTVSPLSQELKLSLQQKINQKTKPLGSLGRLESLALQVGLIQNTLSPELTNTSIIIFAGDHGVVEEGVSAFPQIVTTQMMANFLAGGAAISVFAKQHNLNLWIVDSGVNANLEPHSQLIHAKIAKGTKNFLHDSAMTNAECVQALNAGAEIVFQQQQTGCNCIGFGEMGIGNTSSAALLMHRLTDIPLTQCVGRGTGLNDKQLEHKFNILQQALSQHSNNDEPLAVLATFGGFEIAMMVGAYLKAAELGMVIMVDGFIAGSALLVAYQLQPNVLDYCIFSHVSNEQGHRALLDYFHAEPLLDLQLRLGEGSAITLAYPLLQSAVTFLNNMATFEDAGVSDK
jgi:nicotinate-nucleotide--dimethylbenzimidazole phosphoribosyltransferase